ncbi:hypothetical protein DMA11_06045 [Marinilabiliaceae bacterium JC017]|nr:hypothetical protein DMA11_06045 [Marinilabiliaceae bacterium JC017]
MSRKKNLFKEFVHSNEDIKEFKNFSFKDLINGRILTRSLVVAQLPFILFVVFLGYLYIGNHYRVEELMKEISVLNRELKELRYEAITTSSELMFMSKQSEVLKKVEANGLKLEDLTEPPRKLEVSK